MNAVGDLNLWALGYEDAARAKEVRAALRGVEDLYGLHVLDAVAVERKSDGSFALERDESPSVSSGVLKSGLLGVLVGLVVLEPLGGARRIPGPGSVVRIDSRGGNQSLVVDAGRRDVLARFQARHGLSGIEPMTFWEVAEAAGGAAPRGG